MDAGGLEHGRDSFEAVRLERHFGVAQSELLSYLMSKGSINSSPCPHQRAMTTPGASTG